MSVMSENINEITAAIIEAKGNYLSVEKNKTVKVTMKSGGQYNFSYADLDSILSGINTALFDAGLTVTQLLHSDGVITILSHTSGQWFRSITPVVRSGMNAQEYGSEVTYMKRYALCAITGLVADSDDDGNGACNNKSELIKDDLPWFNDFDKKKPDFLVAIKKGDRTPEQIVSNLRKAFKLSKKTADQIMELK